MNKEKRKEYPYPKHAVKDKEVVKLFQEQSKLKRSSIMTSIILMAVGVVMVMCPAPYVPSVVSVLGYGMLILAATMILDFIAGKKGLMNYIYLTGALILRLLGAAVLVFDDIVLYLGIVFSIALGIFTIRRMTKKK